MKHIFRGCLVVLASILMVGTALAGPIITDMTLPTAATGIGRSDSLSLAFMSDPFTILATDNRAGYELAVAFLDTVASAAVADTAVFVLLHKPSGWTTAMDGMASTAVTVYPKGWRAVYTFAAAILNSTGLPIRKLIPQDSLAVYPIAPGQYRWGVYGGVTDAAHVMNKAYKFRAFVSYKGAE